MEPTTLYDLAPGRIVADRWKVVGAHRQGGLSTAFEMTDETTDERCEMQVFPFGLFDRDDQTHGFRGSFRAWQRIEHDAVVRVREVLELEGHALLLITDFPIGASLRERLGEDGPMSADEVVSLGRQLLSGLDAIHGHGVVHGDAKPHTIHVANTDDGIAAQLVDGGITPGLWTAKNLGEKTALIGTPYYAPPEQFGGGEPDVQSDVYNVAAVLFECLTGQLPWPGKSFLEVFQAKLDRSPPSMSARAPELEVDRDLEAAIVGGCLADRAERYATAGDFLAALERL